jgi:hypothetical protein
MLDSLFTLDKTTLFYWTLSDLLSKKWKHCETWMINKWAAGVPDNVVPASHSTPSYTMVPTTSRSKTGVPSLTTGTSQSRSSVPSVLTNNVKVVSHHSVVSAEVEPEPTEAIAVFSDTGLSDNDETNGEEQLVAINSPPKGKK